MRLHQRTPWVVLAVTSALLVAACVMQGTEGALRHRWWAGLGPVLPHDTFPANCELCHLGQAWNELTADFEFDHLAETGVPLIGAHAQARCLRCHNDRGPAGMFAVQGCVGCHEDVHTGELGPLCTSCHQEQTWEPVGQFELHYRTRFPLIGAHAQTACWRCHPGAEIGNFLPTDTECLTCHRNDMLNANNPNHVNLGYVDNCDRCHLPTNWQQAEVN